MGGWVWVWWVGDETHSLGKEPERERERKTYLFPAQVVEARYGQVPDLTDKVHAHLVWVWVGG